MRQTHFDRLSLARLLAAATVAFGFVFYVVGDLVKPGYSSMSQYISELNATGTAWALQLGYFGFVPLGVLLAVFLIVATPFAAVHGTSKAGWSLMWSLPVAFIGVALAPCDPGCPVKGSPMQMAHDLLGVTTYFASALAIFLLSFAPPLRNRLVARNFLRFTGVAFLVLFVVMLSPAVADIRGLLQRVADALLAGALLVIAWRVVLAENIHTITTEPLA